MHMILCCVKCIGPIERKDIKTIELKWGRGKTSNKRL